MCSDVLGDMSSTVFAWVDLQYINLLLHVFACFCYIYCPGGSCRVTQYSTISDCPVLYIFSAPDSSVSSSMLISECVLLELSWNSAGSSNGNYCICGYVQQVRDLKEGNGLNLGLDPARLGSSLLSSYRIVGAAVPLLCLFSKYAVITTQVKAAKAYNFVNADHAS